MFSQPTFTVECVANIGCGSYHFNSLLSPPPLSLCLFFCPTLFVPSQQVLFLSPRPFSLSPFFPPPLSLTCTHTHTLCLFAFLQSLCTSLLSYNPTHFLRRNFSAFLLAGHHEKGAATASFAPDYESLDAQKMVTAKRNWKPCVCVCACVCVRACVCVQACARYECVPFVSYFLRNGYAKVVFPSPRSGSKSGEGYGEK